MQFYELPTRTNETNFHVIFDGSPKHYRFDVRLCPNPDCPNDDAILCFVETAPDGSPRPHGEVIEYLVNLSTWEPVPAADGAPLPPLVQEMARQVTAGLPEKRKSTISTFCRREKRAQHCRATYRRLPAEINGGVLVSYQEMSLPQPTKPNEILYEHSMLRHDGRTVFIEDSHCANPACPCDQTFISFMELCEVPAGDTTRHELKHLFTVIWHFNGATDFETISCERDEAQLLLAAYRDAYPDATARLRAHHAAVKKMGRRCLAVRRASKTPRSALRPAASIEASGPAKISRNASCPCGSGRKHKRCCGSNTAGR